MVTACMQEQVTLRQRVRCGSRSVPARCAHMDMEYYLMCGTLCIMFVVLSYLHIFSKISIKRRYNNNKRQVCHTQIVTLF